jgi:hypothetical protein
MKRVPLFVAALALILATVTRASAQAEQSKHPVIAVTPEGVRWFTPPYYTDGRQRAQLFSDSGGEGVWVDRVKIPGGMRRAPRARKELARVWRATHARAANISASWPASL